MRSATESPNAAPLYQRSTGSPAPKVTVPKSEVPQRWMDVTMFRDRPMKRTLSGLPLVSQDDAMLLASLNATDAPVHDAIGVHQAIAAQAARTPDAIALRGQGEELSYRTLDERATALAMKLAGRGVRSGDIVALNGIRAVVGPRPHRRDSRRGHPPL